MEKLAICTPVYDGRADVAYVRGVARIRAALEPKGISTVALDVSRSANLPRMRNGLVSAAIEWGADAVLWIDADIIAKADDVLRLIDSGKDIIAAAPAKRPASLTEEPSVAFRPMEGGKMRLENGLVEVGAVATAFCLTRTNVSCAMREAGIAKRLANRDGPQSEWFRNYYWYELEEIAGRPEGVDETLYLDDGEDYYFCRKARSIGFQCWIEPNVRPAHLADRIPVTTNFWDIYGKAFHDQDQSADRQQSAA